MDNKKISFHRRFDSFESNSEALSQIDSLLHFLRIARQSFTIGSPPAELVFSLLKENIAFAISFFGSEHFDIQVRNPDLKIVHQKEIFHSLDGTREMDTGFTRSIYIRKRRPQLILMNEAVQEFLTNFLQDLIDVEEIFIKKQISLDFEQLFRLLESSRRKSTSRRPVSSNKELKQEIAKLKASLFFYRRKLRQVTRKST